MAGTDGMNDDRTMGARPSDDATKVFISSIIPYMAMRAALELEIPSIIAKKVGIDGSLSIEDIVADLPCKSVAHTIEHLERLLVVLVQNGCFSVTSVPSESGGLNRLYGLTDISKNLARDEESWYRHSYCLLTHKVVLSSWCHVHEFILDESIRPVKAAHGKDLWTLRKEDPAYSDRFNRCMAATATKDMNGILAIPDYYGIERVETLVDVGGGYGKSLSFICKMHPHIRGINFDQPHVISEAPDIPGVEHVAGNMFESVPRGDAIMLKKILHDWKDDQCIKILQSCHEALPPSGKVIVVENIVMEDRLHPNVSAGIKFTSNLDVYMMALFGGRERTPEQYKKLFLAAGFQRMKVFPRAPGEIGVIEAYLQ